MIMELRIKEAIRYLGYGKNEIDDRTMELIVESFLELEEVANKRVVYRIFETHIGNENEVSIGKLKIQSKNLYQNLRGCKSAILFGTTLGAEVDRKIRQYEITDLPKAVVFGACAAAYLEEYCDAIQENIRLELGDKKQMRPRFSPGYGDFSMDYQEEILRMIDAQKKIGLTLTEAKMMIPTKSVSAVIGICDTKEKNDVTG